MLRSLPLHYNLRNLGQRRLRTAMTAVGIGLAVFVSLLMHAFSEGMRNSVTHSAYAGNVILLNTNAGEDLTRSRVDKGVADLVAAGMQGIREEHGVRLVSPEVQYGTQVRLRAGGPEHLGVIRGVRPVAFRVHPQVQISEGAAFAPGRHVLVGRLAATKLGVGADELKIGGVLHFENTEWSIAGFFAAPGTVFESEIWCYADDIIVATRREEYTMISLTLQNAEAFKEVSYFCKSRYNLELNPLPEVTFYGKVAETLRPIQILVWVMMLMVTGGGVVAGTNTMYTAVLGRFREFGTLRVLGFGRLAVMLGLMVESVGISVWGGLLGVFLARMANGISLKYPMGAFSFRVDIVEMALGIGLAVGIGLIGSIIPGIRSARMTLVDSIRAI